MRYLIDFSYAGCDFNGYQKQPSKRTVQGEIEKVLSKINNKDTNICAASRTDAKVNAIHQVAHFDFETKITPYKLKGALNSFLPNDIYINNVILVGDSFHARYMVKSKTYEYKINIGNYNPILRTHVFQYCKPLNIKEMKKSSKYLIGEHDFTTFACAEDKRTNKVRNIYNIKISEKDNIITIIFNGNGFLKYQIRNMVGLLIDIASGKKSIDVNDVLERKDRRLSSITAPPQGLTLTQIEYEKMAFK